MGMYTQARGHILLSSVYCDFEKVSSKYECFLTKYRYHVIDEFDIDPSNFAFGPFLGTNGSVWLFIGYEHKWGRGCVVRFIEELVKFLPCEGRVEFQYEEMYEGDMEDCFLIRHNQIQVINYTIHTRGYGFNDGGWEEGKVEINEISKEQTDS